MGDIIGVVQGAVAFILILSSIVFIHELGHFLTAKKFGVYCGEFSIGMGPVIFKRQVGETQYSLRLLPVGGFVSMAGEADDTKKDEEIPFERTIPGIKAYQKIIIMLAGIFMNFILAWVIFVGLSMSNGARIVESAPVVHNVVETTPASEAGLQKGDIVREITLENGKTLEINSSSDFTKQLNYNPETLTLTVERNGEFVELNPVEPRKDEKTGSYQLGLQFEPAKTEKISFIDSFYYGSKDLVDSTGSMFESIGRLVQGKNLDQMSGPVGIYKISSDAVQYGLPFFFRLMALLSVNLGIVNALPLPILDGGRALIVLIEKVMKRKVNEKLLNALMIGGAAVLILLMVFVTFNDVIKLF